MIETVAETVAETIPAKPTEYKSTGFTSQDIRHYHDDKNALYMLPNDQFENDRLLVQHNMVFDFLKGNFLAPIASNLDEGIAVLDSGCGPGAWVNDMANRFPRSTFHGVDITSTVPEQWKLKNTIYSVENITKCLSYEDNFFDYIHQRFLILGLTRVEWINAMKNFYRVLKPGSYIEFLELKLHGYKNAGPLLKELNDTYYKMMVDINMVPNINDELKDMMDDAGFENITVVYKYFPLDMKKKKGRLQWENFYGGFEGFASLLIKYNENWKGLSDFDDHMKKMRSEITETKDILQYAIVYGQKPL